MVKPLSRIYSSNAASLAACGPGSYSAATYGIIAGWPMMLRRSFGAVLEVFRFLEIGQHVGVAPTAIAQADPAIEILALAAHMHLSLIHISEPTRLGMIS